MSRDLLEAECKLADAGGEKEVQNFGSIVCC